MKITALSLLLTVSSAHAAGNFTDAQTVSFKSPNGVNETCRIPRKIAGPLEKQSKFKKDDLKDEAQLCGWDFYQGSGICPKLNSTNPGVLVNELPDGMDKKSFEAQHCGLDDKAQDVEAKFKQSITCSYTPSGLAYYQISRLLGGAGRVPVSVLRTMDKAEHLKIAQRAIKLITDSDDVIARTWGQMLAAHNARPLNRNVFAADGQVYGFMAVNPSGEDIYTEVSGVGSYDTRYERFVQQTPFKRVASTATVQALAGGTDIAQIAPVVVQMKDVSDMILLDTLLTQDDRIGNIHFKFRWYYLENGELEEQKSKAKPESREREKGLVANYKKNGIEAVVPAKELAEMTAKNGFLVKEMLLKDNDCGVDVTKRSNNMRAVNAIEQVRHISPKTYANFMRLAKYLKANPAEAKEYFTKDLLFTEADYQGNAKSFLSNLEKIQTTLLNNCRSGALKQDLDVDSYLPGAAPISASCDI